MRSIAEILGDNIAKYREKQGLTQEQLGRAVGTTRGSINRIEKGKQWPQLETIEKIASHLLVDQKDLFKDTSKDPIQWAYDDISEELRVNEALRAQWIVKRDTIKATRHELVGRHADKEIEQTEKAIEATEKIIATRRRMLKELEPQLQKSGQNLQKNAQRTEQISPKDGKYIYAGQTTNLPADIQEMLAQLPKSSHDTLRAVLKGALRGAGMGNGNGEEQSG